MEKNIEEVLSDPLASNELKIKILTELNNKFEHLRPNKNKVQTLAPPTIPIQVPAILDKDPEEGALEPAVVDEAVPMLEDAPAIPEPALAVAVAAPVEIEKEFRLPSQYHNKITELINIIKLNPNVIRAADTGELVINNNLIPHSKFNDAIRELYQHSLAHTTLGIGLLLSALKSLNVPPVLISNSLRRGEYTNLIHSFQNPINMIHSPKALNQKGFGHSKSHPPGKRPRILVVFKK